MRFGFNGSNTYTLDEIGNKYNLTRERIRQIEKNALKKIQRIEGDKLKSFMNQGFHHDYKIQPKDWKIQNL